MTLVVPFDGSELAEAALVRAVQFERVLDEPVVAVSVVPAGNRAYAEKRGWIDPGDPLDTDAVVAGLRDAVADIAPEAEFHSVLVDRYAPVGTIANRIRRFAREQNASIVFVGSANAGRFVRTITVGQSITAEPAYDTMVVSHAAPSHSETLEEALPTDEVL